MCDAQYPRRPSGPLAQLVEQLTFNQWVAGSIPARLTTEIKHLKEICVGRGASFVRFLVRLGKVLASMTLGVGVANYQAIVIGQKIGQFTDKSR